jgi:thiopurine S-methyltransferase
VCRYELISVYGTWGKPIKDCWACTFVAPTQHFFLSTSNHFISKWSAPKLGWHLNEVNPNIEKYTDLWLGNDSNDNSIFVPLCGKSVDLAFLASHEKVSHVVGIDIVRVAAEQFALEHPDLSMTEVISDETSDRETCNEDRTEQSCEAVSKGDKCWPASNILRGNGITFLLGDLFDFMSMSNEEISTCTKINLPFDAIYDRASMIAIEPSRRQDYVDLLGSMLRPGGSILLVTIEKRTVAEEGAKLSGPPFSIDEEQVRQLYEGHEWVESIALLEEKNEIATDADKERWEARGVSEAYELVFLIRKKEND